MARFTLSFLGIIWVAAPCAAQTVWTQLTSEGLVLPEADQLPDFSSLDTVRSNGIRSLFLAPNGSFATVVNTDPSQGNSSNAGAYYIAGSEDRGETFKALRRETTIGGVEQTSLSTLIGVDNDGSQLYRARHGSTGNPDGLWRDDTLLLTEGDLITAGPLADFYFTSFSWPVLPADGSEVWVSEYSDTSGGSQVGEAIFRGAGAYEVLLQSGDAIGGGLVAQPDLLAGNMSWSLLGSNYVTKIAVSDDFDNDEALVLNGQVLTAAGGDIMREGESIPAAAGGQPGEIWSFGSLVAVNESGDWAISAATIIPDQNGGNTIDDLIVMNGEIVAREGQTIDGVSLPGLPSDLSLNDLGDMAFVADDTVYLNGEVVAQVGDQVDTDGDGAADTTIVDIFSVDLTNLPSADSEMPLMYIEARVTGELEVLLRNERVTLAGDYNGDGVVDAADYTVWRNTFGSERLLAADGDGDNVVGAGDLAVWSENYGGAAGAAAISTPEPTGFAALLLGTGIRLLSARVRR